MITYKSSGGAAAIGVYLDGKLVGHIFYNKKSNMYYYKPKTGKGVGAEMDTLAAVKASIEG